MDGETNGVRKLGQGQLEITLFSSSTKKRISALGNVHRSLEGEGEHPAVFFHILGMS
jgi:hypothetical protein